MAENFTKGQILGELEASVRELDILRSGADNKKPVEVSFGDYTQDKYGLSEDDVFKKIGVNTKIDTMSNIFSMAGADPNMRWVVPEIIRKAITLGLRQSPIYPTLITADESINGLRATMPFINMSDATPARINEAETIPLGNISYGQKDVKLFKVGKGFKLTDEVKNYVSLDVLGIYLKDFGVQLGYALDTMAINTLLNGNITDGSEAADTIGVTSTTNGIQYKDLLRIWIRGSRMGRNFTSMVGGEDESLLLLDLPEFKNRANGTTQATLKLNTPVPSSADFFIHGNIPANNILLIDRSAAMIKLTSRQLMMESERIVSNQTEALYASLTTGFAKMYTDATILMDATKSITNYPLPDYTDVDSQTNYSFE